MKQFRNIRLSLIKLYGKKCDESERVNRDVHFKLMKRKIGEWERSLLKETRQTNRPLRFSIRHKQKRCSGGMNAMNEKPKYKEKLIGQSGKFNKHIGKNMCIINKNFKLINK